jgi:hypothetical protein
MRPEIGAPNARGGASGARERASELRHGCGSDILAPELHQVRLAGNGAGTATRTRGTAEHHESADEYVGLVAILCAKHRVITCKDHLQWILQRRDGERHGWARWAGVGYFLTREALLRASRALCVELDPAALAALAALPDHSGGAGA